jgi:diguanylate cyclase (GGDEF)-like protein
VFARYGGEEFVIILRGIPLGDAGVLAERVRHAIEMHAFVSDNVRLPVTTSIGVAEYSSDLPEAVDLVEAADAALYAAKQSGRNRVLLKSIDGFKPTGP